MPILKEGLSQFFLLKPNKISKAQFMPSKLSTFILAYCRKTTGIESFDFLGPFGIKLPEIILNVFFSRRLVIMVTMANESILLNLLLFTKASSLKTPG